MNIIAIYIANVLTYHYSGYINIYPDVLIITYENTARRSFLHCNITVNIVLEKVDLLKNY